MLSLFASSSALVVGSSVASRSVGRAGNIACYTSTAAAAPLYDPKARDDFYDGNVAQYLVDLHDKKGTFDFCGGMMFQLVLSDKLRTHLEGIANDADAGQPIVHAKDKFRMEKIPGYFKNEQADNLEVFHGRELRSVPDAAGGMNFVLQLSLANADDPEGWTKDEQERYDGWGHDSGREWRKADQYEREGFATFSDKFGPQAYGLHHRFYLHYDGEERLWLSAEDGCEGRASPWRRGARARKPAWMPF